MALVAQLYGFRSIDLSNIAKELERAFGLNLTARESSYRGGVYYLHRTPGKEELILQSNVDPSEGGAAEPRFADYPTLLYVSTDRPERIKSEILRGADITLLEERRG